MAGHVVANGLGASWNLDLDPHVEVGFERHWNLRFELTGG